MSYPLKTLQELCRIIIGRTPSRSEPSYWGKGNKWVSISDLDGKIVVHTKEEITDRAVESARCRRISKGTLLFSFKLTIGKMAFAGEDLFTNEAIAALEIKDPDSVSASYLYYALRAAKVGGSNQAAKGKTLNSKSLAEIEIPLPSLEDQIRIAHLLGKVERLSAQRKQQLQQLDELLKSIFLGMFGDPARNEHGWDKIPIERIVLNARNGLSPAKGGAHLGLVYSLSSVTGEAFKEVYKEDSFSKIDDSYIPAPEDFLVCRGNGNVNLVGRGHFYPGLRKDVMFPDTVIALTIKDGVIAKAFLEALWKTKFIRVQIEKIARTANGTYKINQKSLGQVEIVLPPPEIQQGFENIANTVQTLAKNYQRSLADLEALYGALSRQAFNGELDLSRVPLFDTEAESQTPMPSSSSLAGDEPNGVHLPETELLQAALNDRTRLQELLLFWLDAYRTQLTSTAFSAQAFLAAAHMRIAELHPGHDLELGLDAYEHVKTWAFDRIKSREIKQTLNALSLGGKRKFGNEVVLRARKVRPS